MPLLFIIRDIQDFHEQLVRHTIPSRGSWEMLLRHSVPTRYDRFEFDG